MNNPAISVYTRKHSPWWYISITVTGSDGGTSRIRRSLKSAGIDTERYTRTQALDQARLLFGFDDETGPGDRTLAWLMSDMVARFSDGTLHESTVKKYLEALTDFVRFAGSDTPIDTIKRRPHVAEYKLWLLERGIRPATVNSRCRMLQSIFSKYCDLEIIDANPFHRFKSLRVPDRLVENITPDQEARLFRTLRRARNQDAVKLFRILSFTGRRAEEILELTRDDVDISGRKFRPMNVKASDQRKRWKEIPDEVLADFAFFLTEYPQKKQPYKICRRSTLGKTFRRWRKKAGLPDTIQMKSLRHTFATETLKSGADPIQVMDYLDHSSFRVTQGYYHSERVHKAPLKAPVCDRSVTDD